MGLPQRQRTLRQRSTGATHRSARRSEPLHGHTRRLPGRSDARRRTALSLPSRPSFLGDLEALVGWSLIRSEASDGSVRLVDARVLFASTRSAASRPRLAREGLRERHAERFLELALAAEAKLSGLGSERWVWIRLERELDTSPLDRLAPRALRFGVEDALQATGSAQSICAGTVHTTEARPPAAVGLYRRTGASPPFGPTRGRWARGKRRPKAMVVGGGLLQQGSAFATWRR